MMEEIIKFRYIKETENGTIIEAEEVKYQSTQLDRIEKKLDNLLNKLSSN